MVSDSFVINGKNAFTLHGIPDFSGNLLQAQTGADLYKPSRVQDESSESTVTKFQSLDIAPWGDDNLAPQSARLKLKAIPMAMRAMKLRVRTHYGRGLLLYSELATENDRIQKTPIVNNSVWNEFSKQSNLDVTQARFVSDWEWYMNNFAEIILSNDGRTINRIFRQPAEFCRWKKLNPVNFKSDFVHICSDWSKAGKGNNDVRSIPALDWDNPIQDLRDYIKSGGKKRNFILPIKMEETNAIYYDTPYWTSILDTWAPLAAAIPKVKQALLKNQMVLKFHIKIPFNYWSTNHVGWDDPNIYPQEKKDEVIKKVLDDMNKFLTDVDNTGKSFVSHFGTDKLTGKVVDEWKIDAIDNTKFTKDGQYVTDEKAANQNIISAIGVNSTLIGGLSGSEAGSGSNLREAYAILQAEMWMDRMMTLKWFDHVKDYNQWPEAWKLGYMDIDTSQTLNQNPTGSKLTL